MPDGFAPRYHAAVLAQLQRIAESQGEALEQAARTVFSSLRSGGVLHVFGSGHSHCLAEEGYHRAGGLVPVNAIQEAFLTPLTPPRISGELERVSGLASRLLDGYTLRAGDVLLVVSNSGINPVPIEMAEEGKRRGLAVIALTSLRHSKAVPSRHPRGVRLYEIADLVLDTCGEPGDAAVAYPGLDRKVGPTSLLAGSYIINALVCRIVELFLEHGLRPPIHQSANVPGGDEHNRALESQYRGRVRGL
jgi:uncharacterized phosphosugar-binding protein